MKNQRKRVASLYSMLAAHACPYFPVFSTLAVALMPLFEWVVRLYGILERRCWRSHGGSSFPDTINYFVVSTMWLDYVDV